MNAGAASGAVPQIAPMSARSSAARPIVTMIIEMAGRPISGRSTSRSISIPPTAASATVSTTAIGHANPSCADCRKRQIRAEHQELALREVNHGAALEDQHKTKRDQCEDRAVGATRERQLEKFVHCRLSD